ncbi:MAG: hypothetical protein R3C59_25835 [Planctomycetaceae bacterium]
MTRTRTRKPSDLNGTAHVISGFFLLLLISSSTYSQELLKRWELPLPGQLPLTPLVDQERQVLYVASKTQGLGIFRLRGESQQPLEIARLPKGRFGGLDVMDVTQQGNHLFVALGDFFSARGARAGAAIVDVSDPGRPQVNVVWQSDDVLKGAAVVRVQDDDLYLGAMSSGVIILKTNSARDELKPVTTFLPDLNFPRRNPNRIQHPNARGMWIENTRLFLANDAGGLRVLDIVKPDNPVEIGRYSNPGMAGKQQAYNSLWIDQGLAYVAVDYAGLEIVDVRNPAAMTQVGWWNPWSAQKLTNMWFNSPGHTNQIAFDRDRRHIYLSAGDSELLVIDVADPAQPKSVGRVGAVKNDQGVWGVAVAGDTVFTTYVTSQIPFRGRWSGVKAFSVPASR